MAFKRYCPHCGTTGLTVKQAKGSGLVEFVLWCCYLLPGLIYSVWRRSNRPDVCRTCGSEHTVPLDSPVAQRARAEQAARSTPPPVPTP